MFDLKKIDFIKTDEQRGRKSYSFVGLKRKEEDNDRLEFWLPLGFDDFDETFENSKKFFFKMYRTFQVYKIRKPNQLSEIEKTADRDGVFEEKENGFSFVNKNNEQVVFYGKLNALDKILEGYDELRISSLEKKYIRSIEIDYSKIYKYMHQAIYLEDDVIYLDEMNMPKNVLLHESPPIVQLFCFIYTEIKKELEELDSVSYRAFELSDTFKNTFLQPDSSLFSEATFADTINTLKNVLDDIDTKTIYKDEDFWHFYEAIEAFLMGEREDDKKGIYFGISNFYDIWEDMCQTYMLNPENNYLPNVLFADSAGKLKNYQNSKINPFELKLNNEEPRELRPDLVIIKGIEYDTFLEELYDITITEKQNNDKKKVKEYDVKLKTQDYLDIDVIRDRLIKNYNNNYPKDKNEYKNIRESDFEGAFKKRIFKKLESMPISDLLSRKPMLLKDIKIIDYKYMRVSDYKNYSVNDIDEKGENKIKSDIHKQLVYEWTVQKNFKGSKTESEFWIPYYSDEMNFETARDIVAKTSQDFKESKVKLIKINFKILQENYVKQSNQA